MARRSDESHLRCAANTGRQNRHTGAPVASRFEVLVSSRSISGQLQRRQAIDACLRLLRSCASCRSVFPPIDVLCGECWSSLLRYENHGEALRQEGYPFPVYSSYTWTIANDRPCRSLVAGMKNGWAVRAARSLVERFVQERGFAAAGPAPLFVLPPASSRPSGDHSWLLGQLFSSMWDVEPAYGLKYENWGHSPQKRKSASDRSRRRFRSEEKFSGSRRRFIFIDDVVTTGSTAMAAYMALGDPEQFEVWSLVCRPKLAGKSRI